MRMLARLLHDRPRRAVGGLHAPAQLAEHLRASKEGRVSRRHVARAPLPPLRSAGDGAR
jgi:hypothetical protein